METEEVNGQSAPEERRSFDDVDREADFGSVPGIIGDHHVKSLELQDKETSNRRWFAIIKDQDQARIVGRLWMQGYVTGSSKRMEAAEKLLEFFIAVGGRGRDGLVNTGKMPSPEEIAGLPAKKKSLWEKLKFWK